MAKGEVSEWSREFGRCMKVLLAENEVSQAEVGQAMKPERSQGYISEHMGTYYPVDTDMIHAAAKACGEEVPAFVRSITSMMAASAAEPPRRMRRARRIPTGPEPTIAKPDLERKRAK